MDLWIVRDSKANFSNQMFVQVPVPENYFALLKVYFACEGQLISKLSLASTHPAWYRAREGVVMTYLYLDQIR